jgi:hypothetical protein
MILPSQVMADIGCLLNSGRNSNSQIWNSPGNHRLNSKICAGLNPRRPGGRSFDNQEEISQVLNDLRCRQFGGLPGIA